VPASATTVAAYIANLASPPADGGSGRRASTVRRRLASISQAHQIAGVESPANDPLVRRVVAGIVRADGIGPRRKLPIRVHHLKLIVSRIPSSPIGIRDKALLLLGFVGAFRRSELVGIDCSHLRFVAEGVTVFLPISGTEVGETIGIPYGKHPDTCPVRALRAWLELLPAGGGPVFRPFDRWGHIRQTGLTDEWVANVVKRYVQSIGMDPDQFAGHSLRSGLAVSAASAGAVERSMMNQTRHRSANMVRRYIRDAEIPLSANAMHFTGL
jgi:integrase